MPIIDLDVPAVSDQGLDGPQITDPETQALAVLDEAAEATEILARGRRLSSSSRLGTAEGQGDLLTPGESQPWDY